MGPMGTSAHADAMPSFGSVDACDVEEKALQDKEDFAVVVVDPISTGAVLALLAQQRGYRIIALYGPGIDEELMALVPPRAQGLVFDYTLQHTGDINDTVQRLKKIPYRIKEVFIGCESGVELYEEVSFRLGTSNNGAPQEFRRNKHAMGERVRAAGLRAVRQLKAKSWDEVPVFVESLGQSNMSIVLKPVKSAGTDQVYRANNLEDAKFAFDTILGSTNVFGEMNETVLVQEFLQGREFVVDSVSWRGVHKVTAFWVYDKRSTNGADFVYYGLRLFETADRAIEERLTSYTHAVLDALGITNTCSHAELIWLEDEDAPCLVEVGARPHGGEGSFTTLTADPIGYDQLSVSLDLLEDPASFDRLPRLPPPLKSHAAEACLVSSQSGRLLRFLPGLEEIKEMASVKAIELLVKPGGRIRRTRDIITTPGSILLGHPDAAVLEADYTRIHELEASSLFEVECDSTSSLP